MSNNNLLDDKIQTSPVMPHYRKEFVSVSQQVSNCDKGEKERGEMNIFMLK